MPLHPVRAELLVVSLGVLSYLVSVLRKVEDFLLQGDALLAEPLVLDLFVRSRRKARKEKNRTHRHVERESGKSIWTCGM